MSHERVGTSTSEAQGEAAVRTPDNADAFVSQLFRECGFDSSRLADAIRRAGRSKDEAVFSSLRSVIGNAEAGAVMAKAAAKTALTAEGTHKKVAAGVASQGAFEHDGQSVDHGRAAGVELTKDEAAAKVSTDTATTDAAGVTAKHSLEGGVSYGADGPAATAEHGNTTSAKVASEDGSSTTASQGTTTSAKVSAKGGSADHTWSRQTETKDAKGDPIGGSSRATTIGGELGPEGAGGSATHTGSTTNATGTKTSASATGAVALGPDHQAISAGGGLGRETKDGTGFDVGFRFSASKTKHDDTITDDHGHKFSRLEIDTQVEEKATAGVHNKRAGLDGGWSQGKEATFTATVPEKAAEGLDLAKLDPGHPDRLPVGASIRMDSAKFKASSLSGKIDGLTVGATDKHSKGSSVLVEKLDDHRVRVTAGPTEAIEQTSSFGVDFGVVGAAILGTCSVKDATLHSAIYDLATPDGPAGYRAFLGGTAPKPGTKGALDVQTIERMDLDAQATASAHVGPVGGAIKGDKIESHWLKTTAADGSVHRKNRASEGDHELAYDEQTDAQGKRSSETYTLVLKADRHGDIKSWLSMIPGVKPNAKAKEFHYELTRPQLESLYQQACRAAATMKHQGMAGDSLVGLVEESKDAEDFLWRLHSSWDGADGEAKLLQTISDASAGTYGDDHGARLPGKLA
jgi:hypothetical protein